MRKTFFQVIIFSIVGFGLITAAEACESSSDCTSATPKCCPTAAGGYCTKAESWCL